ncbi:unnamed protein product [Meganyctiphanes norvegica]|uniref:Uncharacterized protein n=1 Tax=Meganyctiphanes norvegica TaxID=48144 RepID=A0AAV2SEC1_MEGNR
MACKVICIAISMLSLLWLAYAQEDEDGLNNVDVDDYFDADENISKLQRQFDANTSIQIAPGFLILVGGLLLLLFLISSAFAGSQRFTTGQSSYSSYDYLYDNAQEISRSIQTAARRYMC